MIEMKFDIKNLEITKKNWLQVSSPPPLMSWNIVPSMGQSYSISREVELVSVSKFSLKPVEKVGSCPVGEVSSLKESKSSRDELDLFFQTSCLF